MSTPAHVVAQRLAEPAWLQMASEDPVLLGVLRELLENQRFRLHADSALAPMDGSSPFRVKIGGPGLLAPLGVKMPEELGGFTVTNEADQVQKIAGIAIDVDKLHQLTGQDSTRAREAVRDALIHEFGHVLPIARTRSLASAVDDPKPGQDAASAPSVQSENRLRALLGLKAKSFYGLLP